jgi:hypothetical protein
MINPFIFYRLQITNYKLQITNYKLQITNYKLQITNYKLPTANYQLSIINYQLSTINCFLPQPEFYPKPVITHIFNFLFYFNQLKIIFFSFNFRF